MKYPDFSKTYVLIVGDLMLDKYHFGQVNRVSPEAPVPVVRVKQSTYTLGGAGNVVNNLYHLGANACLIGMVGNCANGNSVKNLLDERKVKYRLLTRQSPTITKVRIIGDHQQIVRVDFEEIQFLSQDELETVKDYIDEFLDNINCVVISDYGKGMVCESLSRFVINRAKERSLSVLVDPKGNDWEKYRGATMITPNVKELAGAAGKELANEDREIEILGNEIRKKYDIKYLLVTRSERGMTLLSENGSHHIRSEAREVYDVSGAGDTVVATVAAALSAGLDVEEAVKIANKAAGIVVGKLGTAPVSIDELKAALGGSRNGKIVSLEVLLKTLKRLRAEGKKIVFTNGCFDILHKGHVAYLQKAREFGDVLIVGLNSDESVRRLKGSSRPVNSEADRAFVLAGLEMVNYVVIFDEDTPYEILSRIRPDVLVKGGDYKDVEDSEFAGRVEIIDFFEDPCGQILA
jgi:D-beta-D-heptose 7-phosphate kinase/D-beta-D-heptose 1-phosphate adenosyltransferase